MGEIIKKDTAYWENRGEEAGKTAAEEQRKRLEIMVKKGLKNCSGLLVHKYMAGTEKRPIFDKQ